MSRNAPLGFVAAASRNAAQKKPGRIWYPLQIARLLSLSICCVAQRLHLLMQKSEKYFWTAKHPAKYRVFCVFVAAAVFVDGRSVGGYISAAITSSRDIVLRLWRCSSVSCPRVAEPQRKSLSQASRIRFACWLFPLLSISSASLSIRQTNDVCTLSS